MSDQLEARARRISIEFLKACEPTHLAGEGSFIAFDPAVVDIPDWEVEFAEAYEHSSFSLVGNRERRVTMCVHRLYQSWVVGFDHEHPARAQGRRGVWECRFLAILVSDHRNRCAYAEHEVRPGCGHLFSDIGQHRCDQAREIGASQRVEHLLGGIDPKKLKVAPGKSRRDRERYAPCTHTELDDQRVVALRKLRNHPVALARAHM